jgi:thiol-disulfide isomerase/thioredoxin
MARRYALPLSVFVFAVLSCAQILAQPSFAPVDQWREALAAGDMASFQQFYETTSKERGDLTSDVQFWSDLRKAGMRDLSLEMRKNEQGGDTAKVLFQAIFVADTPSGPRHRYVVTQQFWKKVGERWVIAGTQLSPLMKVRQPRQLNPNLYPKNADATQEIKHAIAEAGKTGKRIILVFGGNWCVDCHMLDAMFHEPEIAPLAEKNFIVVHVDIGHGEEKNRDITQKYHTPLDKGVPVLAVVDSSDKLIYSQQNGEFESARSMDPDDLIAFLNKWKP